MAEREYQITQESYNKLVAELEEMKSVKRKEVSEKIKVARSFGDLSENSEYDEAMNEQGILEAQIKEKEAFLNHVVEVSDEDITTDKVGLGIQATVKNLDRDRIQTFRLVSSNEVDPTGEVKYISEDSPVGKALVGRKVGDICEAELPGGRIAKYEILELKRGN